MSYDYYGDFETFMHDDGCDRIFWLNVYNKHPTSPIGEDMYENNQPLEVIIKEIINLPNDILLGVVEIFEDDTISKIINYYRLSEIRLFYKEPDNDY